MTGVIYIFKTLSSKFCPFFPLTQWAQGNSSFLTVRSGVFTPLNIIGSLNFSFSIWGFDQEVNPS